MAPSAIDEQPFVLPPNKRPPERTYPPARIFPVQEVKFEKSIPVQEDGREKALAQPEGSAAIVIDTGRLGHLPSVDLRREAKASLRIIQCSGRMVIREHAPTQHTSDNGKVP